MTIDLTDAPAAPVTMDRSRAPVGMFGKTPLAVMFRHVEPTWRNYIMYIDLEARAGNADAARYLETWVSLPLRERNTHMPEQVCELSNVKPEDLVSWVARQMFAEGAAKVSMCLSVMRDRVIEQTAQFAMQSPDNHNHVKLFAQMAGLISAPGAGGRGPVNNIYNVPVSSSGSVALAGSRSESSPVHASGLRDMDSEIVELAKIMQDDSGDKALTVMDEGDDNNDEDEDNDEEDE